MMNKPDNHVIVIFGASGDLTRRKLIPSLYHLYKQDLMPSDFTIMGCGRTNMSDEEFREEMEQSIRNFTSSGSLEMDFRNKLVYQSVEYASPGSYKNLKQRIDEISNSDKDNILFYLATPPSLYPVIPEMLAREGLNHKAAKLIVEKPFGTNLQTAHELNESLLNIFSEDQIYRIDHYLGKETVQNILVTRFSNTIFEPLWSRNYIQRVEITSAESLGVSGRGGYYDNSGALRDMVQNHLLQLVGLVAMEPPVNADSVSIRNELIKVFQSFRPLTKSDIRNNVIRGQYTESMLKGEKIISYRDEKGVKENSRTETYAALKFYIDNWRWKDVPFYIRTGKCLPTRVTEIVIHFSETPHHIFCNSHGLGSDDNQLIIRIQPDEGILLKFGMKVPGSGFEVQTVNMDFHYASISGKALPDAYERLLLDCMQNDPTLFARHDAVESTWQFITPILEAWREDPSIPLYGYPAGTWGPDVADALIEGRKTTWRYPCKNLSNDGIYCEL